jgi:NADH-quinone oxidoreductase subunit C
MSEALQELGTKIATKVKGVEALVVGGELTLTTDVGTIPTLAEVLKTDPNCKFTSLVDITAIDYPERATRFTLVYHFLSMYTNLRVRVKADIADGDLAPTLTGIHPSAGWFEREVFDMFGITFAGHADMRRLLTDYGFQGHPLRKDFPTTGYTEVRYDEVEKRVIYEPVKLVQDYRQFDFMSPWEGAQYILPGDEKKEAAK